MRSGAGTAEPPRERPACRMLPPRRRGACAFGSRPWSPEPAHPRRGRGRGATAAGLSPPDCGAKMPRAGVPVKRAKGASVPFR